MFEIVNYAYCGINWVIYHVLKAESESIKSVKDPGTFLAAALAGSLARTCVISLDQGGPKGPLQAVLRRTPQFGALMLFYTFPASHILPGMEEKPPIKMMATFLVGACAGFNMRLICNPLNRVMDEALRTGKPGLQVARVLKNKTILQFWYTGPNLFANALYFGTLLTVFEGLRRFSERNFFPLSKRSRPSSAEGGFSAGENPPNRSSFYMQTAAVHFVSGGVSAAVATTLCYPYSAHRYLQTVIHDSAICRGLGQTLVKEVPMMAVFFGTFSLLQPIFAPHHGVRCGFGY